MRFFTVTRKKRTKVIFFTMVYNAEQTIGRTIKSILNQTFDNFEYYILDNGTTDHTADVIWEYAGKDTRIKPIAVKKNDPGNGGAFFLTLASASDADYIVWCDADDTYSPDFLEKTVPFAQKNQLDITACGYESIDGMTGKILKHRAIEKSLVIEKDLFTKEFIQYRGFTGALWGKLYALRFFKSTKGAGTKKRFQYFGESTWLLDLFWKAKKVGVIPDALYQWYQYPDSLSRANWIDNLKQYPQYWLATKTYLERYGKISKLNEDFLYAIYLSLVEEAIGNVFSSELDTQKKLELLEEIFSEPTWSKTLERKADPMFRNLAGRKEFVSDIKRKVSSLPNIEAHLIEKQHLFTYF